MIDGHAHIFLRRLVGTAPLRYKPYRDATLPAYLSQLDQFGIRGGVLVQPSFLGCDNGYLLQGLRRGAGRLRGIAVIAPDCPLATMRDMDAAGVVGLRLNLFGRPLPDLRSRAWRRCLARAARLGWQVEVHRPAQDWPLLLPPLLDAGVKVVIDHFGRPHPALGVDDPGFRYLLDAGAASGRIWVKISAAYRNGLAGRGEDIARAALPLLDGALGPERMLWGSDWPHTIRLHPLRSHAGTIGAVVAGRRAPPANHPRHPGRAVPFRRAGRYRKWRSSARWLAGQLNINTSGAAPVLLSWCCVGRHHEGTLLRHRVLARRAGRHIHQSHLTAAADDVVVLVAMTMVMAVDRHAGRDFGQISAKTGVAG